MLRHVQSAPLEVSAHCDPEGAASRRTIALYQRMLSVGDREASPGAACVLCCRSHPMRSRRRRSNPRDRLESRTGCDALRVSFEGSRMDSVVLETGRKYLGVAMRGVCSRPVTMPEIHSLRRTRSDLVRTHLR